MELYLWAQAVDSQYWYTDTLSTNRFASKEQNLIYK